MLLCVNDGAGEIPASLGQLNKLTLLSLAGNELNGMSKWLVTNPLYTFCSGFEMQVAGRRYCDRDLVL